MVVERIDLVLQLFDGAKQVMCGVEFVSPFRLGALGAAVEVGALGGHDVEFDDISAASVVEFGPELGHAVDLEPTDRDQRFGA